MGCRGRLNFKSKLHREKKLSWKFGGTVAGNLFGPNEHLHKWCFSKLITHYFCFVHSQHLLRSHADSQQSSTMFERGCNMCRLPIHHRAIQIANCKALWSTYSWPISCNEVNSSIHGHALFLNYLLNNTYSIIMADFRRRHAIVASLNTPEFSARDFVWFVVSNTIFKYYISI